MKPPRQMSFLESSSSNENQSRLIVKEFKDPFCFSSSSNEKSNPNLPSRNKWSSTEVENKRRSYSRVNTDVNNNSTESRKTLNRKSSTVSIDELHGGKDEISAISSNDKPILRLWAQKNKSNAAITSANRNSYLGSPNDAKKVLGQISGTPWGKYLKNNNDSSLITNNNRPSSYQDKIKEHTTTIDSANMNRRISDTSKQGPPVRPKKTRPKSAYFERNFDNHFAEVPINNEQENSTIKNRERSVNSNATESNTREHIPTSSTNASTEKETSLFEHSEKSDEPKEKKVEYHNSFLDELDDLEAEIDEQLKKPPPVPRRSSSKSSELVDFFKKIQIEEAKTTISLDTASTTSSVFTRSNQEQSRGNFSKDIVSDGPASSEDVRIKEGKFKGITHDIDNNNNDNEINDDNNNIQPHYITNSSSQINTGDCVKEKLYQKTSQINYSKKVHTERKARSSSAAYATEYIHSNFISRHSSISYSPDFNRAVSVAVTPDNRRRSLDTSRFVGSRDSIHSASDSGIEESNSATPVERSTQHTSENKQDNNSSAYIENPPKHHGHKHHNKIIQSSDFVTKKVEIDIAEPDSAAQEENNSNVNSYTDIFSQITGVAASHQKQNRRNSLPLAEKESSAAVAKATIFVNGGQKVSLARQYSESATKIKTNFSDNESEQPCEATERNHKHFCIDNGNIVTEEGKTEGEMGSRYYPTTSTRTGDLNSYYDRQHESIFKTSPMSTQLSRYNNESANITDKYFGRKSSFDSNDFSIHNKGRTERSFSLNEDYNDKFSRPYLTKSTRRTSEDISSSTNNTSYVPKSNYLRQRLLELQSDEVGQSLSSETRLSRENSVSSNNSSRKTSRQGYNEDKVDEFIRNHRERRSGERKYSNTSSYTPSSVPSSTLNGYKGSGSDFSNTSTYDFTRKTSTEEKYSSPASLTSDSRKYSASFSNTNQEEEKPHKSLTRALSDPAGSTSVDYLQFVPEKLAEVPEVNDPASHPSEDYLQFVPEELSEVPEAKDNLIANNIQNSSKENSPITEEPEVMDKMRRSSLKKAVVRRFSLGGDTKKKDTIEDDKLGDIQESPFNKSIVSTKTNQKDKTSKSSTTITISSNKNRFGKEKSAFGNITKITSSKISAASDLKSFSSRRRDKLRTDTKNEPSQDEASNSIETESKADDPTSIQAPTSPDGESKSKTFSRFSLKKKKPSEAPAPAAPSSPKQETKQRKHSLTSVFHKHKKDKDEPTTSPRAMSPTGDEPVTSPTHNKDRRGSAFSRLFSKKHELHHQESLSKEDGKKSSGKITVNSKKTISEKDSLPERPKSMNIVVNSKSTNDSSENKQLDSEVKESVDKTAALDNSLIVPGSNDPMGSTDSLYDSDTGESSTKRSSRNKERIRNRKLAKKEAAERHKSLPAGLGDVEIDMANGIAVPVIKDQGNQSGGSQTSLTEATPRTRKKHRARRANTEFIGNVPMISVEQASPMVSRDDGAVGGRRTRRNRRDRPKTLTNGIGNQEGENDDGVVNENLTFADIKKKLLEGLTDDKKIPDKVPQKERQKIKRTKSTKRYKTITEGIAPRDLELARQAIEAEKSKEENGNGSSRNTIDTDTLAQITAALTSTTDKRKSFIVESRPGSRYQSNEDLRMSDPENQTKDDSELKPQQAPVTSRALLRTKSMTTLHLQDLTTEADADEPEIKPLSDIRNKFLQAMEDTKQKHNQKKSPVDIKRRAKRDRKDRPHTICGIDSFTMGALHDDIANVKAEQAEKDSWMMEQIKNEINEVKSREEDDRQVASKKKTTTTEQPKKKEKKKYTRANSEKIFNDVFDDIDDILNEGFTEADLAGILDCNPSMVTEVTKPETKKDLELVVKGNNNVDDVAKVVNGTGEPLSDLDFISSQSTQLSSSLASDKRKLRPQRKQRTAANPMKSLQKREDLIDEVAVADKQKEDKMNKMDLQSKFLRKNDLADEAVNALRATVDYSKTKLRKVEVNKKTMADDVLDDSFVPTEFENLLIQVKGRRKCQTTLVEFQPQSLNSNDCFIICTPNSIMCWHGSQSNVIEKSKAAEVASRIQQKKEMGIKAFEVIYVDQGAGTESKVLRLLGGGTSSKVDLRAPVVNDEDFEKAMISAYMTYVVCETSDPPVLIPLDSQCHRMPTKEILQTDSAFVFDFITEVYVWIGRQTKSEQRRIVQKLAAEKFKEGYYKLNMEHSALSRIAHTSVSSRKISVQAEGVPHAGRRGSKPQGRRASVQQGRHQKREMEPRPEHSMLLQLFEGAEWVIFKEKFCDWPDESRIIRMKDTGEVTKEVSTEIQIEPVDVSTMTTVLPSPKMVLDNLDVGRGRGIPKGMDGYHIITLDVKTWHVHENQSLLLPDESFGQFHSGEGYVIRWQYRVVKVRALRNVDDIMKAGGIERCCYFFWLGNDCSVNEEGATAVMTIELDREKGPQIRVVLGKEPPALLQVFDGSMIIHAGKRPVNGVRRDYTDKSLIRLYTVRNEEEAEACLLQVPAITESLRSRTSFILLLCNQGEVLLWHGCKSNEGTRKAAEHAVQNLIHNHPEEAAIAEKSEIGLIEVEEGEEPEVFWMALGGREEYGSLVDDPKDYSKLSLRLFQLESQTGQFLAHEVSSPSKGVNHNCPFPILQDDLYNVEQPAIFLLDVEETVYLWFGWWPDNEEGTEASNSRRRRWDEERRKAMESAVAYANEVGRNLDFMYAVYAGLEPEGFIELFPYWVVQEDITDLQLDEGIEEEEINNITDELAIFSKEFYTIEELRQNPPPKGVDPTKLEKYLSPEDFMAVFKFSKETFMKLPGWQQVNWKKKIGLY